MSEKRLNLLESLIEYDSIAVQKDAKNWEEAIKLSVEPLVSAGIVSSKYYDDIIESTTKYGPYYIIVPGLAMPHASATENSVFGNGFSLVTLKKPIKFPNDAEVSVLLCIGAKDGETHTQVAIPQIVAIFEDPANVEKIAKMETKEEIIKFIEGIDFTKYLQ